MPALRIPSRLRWCGGLGSLLLLLGQRAFAQEVRYVNGDAAVAGNGLTWQSPLKYLQDALAEAEDLVAQGFDVQLWVASTDAANPYRPDRDAAKPDGTGDREASFALINNVEVFGGFAGDESSLTDRDPDENVTVLSGDLSGDDGPDFTNNVDNSLRIVLASDVAPSAVLDGFTITGGNASDGIVLEGGAVRCQAASPTIRRCNIRANYSLVGGAAASCYQSMAIFDRCTFEDNLSGTDLGAGGKGGAVRSHGSSPAFVQCTFRGNHGKVGGALAFDLHVPGTDVLVSNCILEDNFASSSGGAIVAEDIFDLETPDSVIINNTVFRENRAFGGQSADDGRGGAVYVKGTAFHITNCTFVENIAVLGGGVTIENANVPVQSFVRNCILFGNVAYGTNGEIPGHQLWVAFAPFFFLSVDYNYVEGGVAQLGGPTGAGGYFGPNNKSEIDGDPMFESAPANLRLTAGSPCIDSGDPDESVIPTDEHDVDGDANTQELTPDLDRKERVANAVVDMGAYECDGVSGCPGDANEDGITDVLDLLLVLAEWNTPPPHDADIAPACGDGAVNVQDLLLVLGQWGPCESPGSVSPPSSVGQCLGQYSDLAEQIGCIEMLIKTGQL